MEEFEACFHDYIDAVKSGRRIAGSAEKQAVDRHLADVVRSKSDPDWPYEFRENLGEDACRFLMLLQHTDGEYSGKPFKPYPWQVFILFNLFGWVHSDTKYRRFREAFVSMGRGNGKTPFGAAIMLLLFGFDNPVEDRAEVYTAAVKRDQASLSFDAAKRFVERAGLAKFIQVLKFGMIVPRTQSTFKPLSSEGRSADGLQIHGLLRDELHAWSNHQRDFYAKLQTAMGKRRQPLAITITTAGNESSELWSEQYKLAKCVIDPSDDTRLDSLFVFICEIDDADDELEESVWPKANPMLEYGIVKIGYLREEAIKAKRDSGVRHDFRRYHGNRLAMSSEKTFRAEDWGLGGGEIDVSKIKGIHAGVDLGWCDDFAAIGYVAPLDWVSVDGVSRRRYYVWSDVWIPRGTRRDLRVEPFATWIAKGLVSVTESQYTDTAPMYQRLKEQKAKYGIKTLAFDPNNAREFALTCENVLKLKTYAFGQTHAKYHEPFQEFKRAIRDGRIFHGNDEILTWSALNVVEHRNQADLIMPAKARSLDKIDPFVAVLMAFSEAIFADRVSSRYERSGPIVLR